MDTQGNYLVDYAHNCIADHKEHELHSANLGDLDALQPHAAVQAMRRHLEAEGYRFRTILCDEEIDGNLMIVEWGD